ncbi:hypothetical protein PISMIDRAFT_15110 [Pisolithus microcarpus 441]|uniref:Uncharacterized protein n=1 Tax=Pisolithus microcarpus 441 TaxID=765257 RepID=A0A0C9XY67_9AGAM|nr:hypothetical protein PISMIDRAFT_15110 [Pisolithus microcarpus 441]
MENYYEWRRQTEQLLLGQGVYSHVSNGTNPFDYVKYASNCPCPLIPAAPTVTEQEAIKAWFKDDGLANITAREVWNTLAELYDRSDVSLQFSLCTHISTLQMKGAADAEKYVASHVQANDKLARMGARPSDADAIYVLLRGLPKTGLWPVVRKNIETELERSEQLARTLAPGLFSAVLVVSQSAWPLPANTPVTPQNPFAPMQQFTNPFLTPPVTQYGQHAHTLSPAVRMYTFKHAAQTVIKEAIQVVNEGTAAGPGSEYANAAMPGGRGEVNPVTGLQKTRNNPNHDWNNCFQAGGGRAGQAPWQKGKGGAATNNTPQVAAVASLTPSTTNMASQPTGAQTNMPMAAAAIQCPPTEDYFRNLSCAILEELHDTEAGGSLACHVAVVSSTILDSGTTTHLIRDSSFFWTFTRDSTVSMKMANQGSLNTEGYGDCIAVLKLRGK